MELFETGVAIMRQNLRRRFPKESEGEIDRRLTEWLRTRPGAEFGDAPSEGHRPRTHDPT